MKRLALLTPTIVLIAACSGGNETIQPGQWETTVRMTEIELPGVPEAVAAQMRQAMTNQAQTQSRCITPEEAANPTRGMVNPSGDAQGCTFTDQTFAGGRIQVAGNCPAPGNQGSVTTTMTGTYTPTTMEAQVTAEVRPGASAPPGGPQVVRMRGNMTSRRTGDCAAG